MEIIKGDNLSYRYQINNPSDLNRYEMLKNMLKSKNREEDLDNIIKLMSPPEDINNIYPAGNEKDIKIAVIGAGEAGLSAALELRRSGCNITLFEASNRVGGRVYTYYFDRNKKHFGEFGPMDIPISHYTTWHYINLFNLKTSLSIKETDDSFIYIRGKKHFRNDKNIEILNNIYDEFDLKDEEKLKINQINNEQICDKYFNYLSVEERKELIEAKDKYLSRIEKIDKLTYRKAYEDLGFSEGSISMLGLMTGNDQFFGLSITEILQQYYTLDSEISYYINDGMIKLPLLLYEALTDNEKYPYKDLKKSKLGNVTIKMESPVEGIFNSEKSNKVSLKYKDKELNESKLEEFDYVICTIPFTCLKRIDINPIFNVKKMQAISEMNYENSSKIYMYFKERFWEREKEVERIRGGRSFTDLPLVSLQYPSNILEKYADEKRDESGVLLASYSLGSKSMILGNEDYELQINDAIRYLGKIYNVDSKYIIKNLINYKSLIWSDVQYIWGAAALSKPGYKTMFSHELTMPEMDNKLFFAGEHISQKHGTQQGALQSGMIAANNIAKIIREKSSL